MTHPEENPFSDFDEAYKNTDPVKGGSSIGRLPEHNSYKGVCTTVDLKGDGVMVDHEIFAANSGTKGLKIFLEILEPEKVGETTVKGEVHEHVWWVTEKTLGRIKWDASMVLGKVVPTMGELARVQWAGHTVEFGLKDEARNGFVNSRVSFFNAWNPNVAKDQKKEVQKEIKKQVPTPKAEPQKASAPKAQAAQKSNVDF